MAIFLSFIPLECLFVLTSKDRGYAQIIAVMTVYPLIATDQCIKCRTRGTMTCDLLA